MAQRGVKMIHEEKTKYLTNKKACGFCSKPSKILWFVYEDTEKNILISYVSFGICKRCLNKKIRSWK